MAAYYEQFNNTIDMLEHCGVSLGKDDGIITKVLEHHDINPTTATVTEFRQPLQVQSHLEMLRILVQLGHIQCT